LSVVDCCPQVPNPEPGTAFDADSPAPCGSATQHPALAPVGPPDSPAPPDTAPNVSIIGDQHPTVPRSTQVPVPGAPSDTVPAAHVSSATLPRCQATPSTSVCVPCAPHASAPASHVSSGEAPGSKPDTTGGSASGIVPGSSVLLAPSPRRTKLMNGIVKLKIYKDGTVRYVNLTTSTELYNATEALSTPE
jgi:hypothetical protein